MRVVEVVLHFNGLRGPVPDVFAQLPMLERLDLGASNLTGTVPGSIGSLMLIIPGPSRESGYSWSKTARR